MGESIGTDVELTLTGIAHGGFAVGRLDGRVIFVSDAIPGETVTARVTDDSKASFWRADAIAVSSPSPHRVPHVWAEAGIDRPIHARVGGADFGHIALSHQRELKRDVLKDALSRFGKLDETEIGLLLDRVESLPGDDERNGLGWRTRVRLHVNEQGQVGPRAHPCPTTTGCSGQSMCCRRQSVTRGSSSANKTDCHSRTRRKSRIPSGR